MLNAMEKYFLQRWVNDRRPPQTHSFTTSACPNSPSRNFGNGPLNSEAHVVEGSAVPNGRVPLSLIDLKSNRSPQMPVCRMP